MSLPCGWLDVKRRPYVETVYSSIERITTLDVRSTAGSDRRADIAARTEKC